MDTGFRGNVKIQMAGTATGRGRLQKTATFIGETSKLIGCGLHIQQPAAANLYRKCYTLLLNAAAFGLQPAVMNFDVFPYLFNLKNFS